MPHNAGKDTGSLSQPDATTSTPSYLGLLNALAVFLPPRSLCQPPTVLSVLPAPALAAASWRCTSPARAFLLPAPAPPPRCCAASLLWSASPPPPVAVSAA
ncbi:hypothetical protein GGX14DRAFT_563151 [Mycena pura]|uniref:Uncharacterized protein n=1 Tax=Mycena pura TaxID=153505 RepID=A0AAD6YJ53_9AGAR|nr:hypothetical protein GGX14DRAFT_563151 [Mycena pura]